jgi:hypothetical protein
MGAQRGRDPETDTGNKGTKMTLRFAAGLGAAFIALLVTLGASFADSDLRLPFVTHASFFSTETKQAKPIDPQVFVQDKTALSGTGPQNIQHPAGLRPALIAEDSKSTPLFNAKGEPLGFNLGDWLGAEGKVTIRPAPRGRVRISATFSGLKPHGSYSLFENHFDQQPVGFTPLDGAGKANNFVADARGRARVSMIAPDRPTDANAILLVYHSDHMFHGTARGEIGVTAHHQLIAPIPKQ